MLWCLNIGLQKKGGCIMGFLAWRVLYVALNVVTKVAGVW